MPEAPSLTLSLKGRRALVTGSSRGLGAVIVRSLAEAGADVVMTGLEAAEAVEAVRADIAAATGVRVDYIQADLGVMDQVTALAERAAADRPVDILVNNAVIRHFALIEQFPLERWDEALRVNLSAPFQLTRLLLPAMRERGYGRIFNFTSVYGSRGEPNRIGYVCTKAGIEGLTRGTAIECADGAVTCHALCPGSMLTPTLEERVQRLVDQQQLGWDEAVALFLKGKQPTGRFIDEKSVANMLLFLCGAVGRDMNGAVIPIDGGWLASA
jgi:3-hydroxybutyrate dehydrogenase